MPGFHYCTPNADGSRLGNVVDVFKVKFADDAIRVACPADIPLELPYGIKWADLNALTPEWYSHGLQRSELEWKDLFYFYLRSFFNEPPEVMYIHVWKSQVRGLPPEEKKKELTVLKTVNYCLDEFSSAYRSGRQKLLANLTTLLALGRADIGEETPCLTDAFWETGLY